ncbi:MAG: PTS sugar transporter subunit IIA [Planctomycetes bacterium]|nr:PTS sugar transporter subunit IIA [Planctomycetota bacterium]
MVPEDLEELSQGQKFKFKQSILALLVESLDTSGHICNPSKCLSDLSDRERKATTGLGSGFAMPHVRTLQARELTIAILRSDTGVFFDALDREPVKVFFAIVCPPYADKEYMRLLSCIGRGMQSGNLMSNLTESQTPTELMGRLCRMSE